MVETRTTTREPMVRFPLRLPRELLDWVKARGGGHFIREMLAQQRAARWEPLPGAMRSEWSLQAQWGQLESEYADLAEERALLRDEERLLERHQTRLDRYRYELRNSREQLEEEWQELREAKDALEERAEIAALSGVGGHDV